VDNIAHYSFSTGKNITGIEEITVREYRRGNKKNNTEKLALFSRFHFALCGYFWCAMLSTDIF
jgi:hypothetical protein